MDQALQQRAGLNVGIESNPPFVQAAACPEIDVNINGDTVLMVGVKNGLRTPFTRGTMLGMIFNDESADYGWALYFIDELGNELLIADAVVSANSVNYLDPSQGAAIFNPGMPLSLDVGEKIVLRVILSQIG